MLIPSCRLTAASMMAAAAAALLAAEPAIAAQQILDGVLISSVSLNGGIDTTNPGTTCVRILTPVLAACPSGYVAIQNNNKQLIAAALQAKATSSSVWFYYDDAGASFHCPGKVFTPCSVVSIELK